METVNVGKVILQTNQEPHIGKAGKGRSLGHVGRSMAFKRSRFQLARKQTQVRADSANALFPLDCYGPPPVNQLTTYRKKHGNKRSQPNLPTYYLLNEDPMDMVARLENAELAGMDIPWEFTETDILTAYIPDRRTIAFGYALLRPDVGDHFSKACEVSQIPHDWANHSLYRNMRAMQFLTQFWKERITAIAGVTYIYANKHARMGSAPHLKLLSEMTGLIKPEAKPGDQHQHAHFHMPDPKLPGSTGGSHPLQPRTQRILDGIADGEPIDVESEEIAGPDAELFGDPS